MLKFGKAWFLTKKIKNAKMMLVENFATLEICFKEKYTLVQECTWWNYRLVSMWIWRMQVLKTWRGIRLFLRHRTAYNSHSEVLGFVRLPGIVASLHDWKLSKQKSGGVKKMSVYNNIPLVRHNFFEDPLIRSWVQHKWTFFVTPL